MARRTAEPDNTAPEPEPDELEPEPADVEPDTEPDPEPAAAETAPAFRVMSRIRYERDGNEFFAGAGELIDAETAGQVDPASVEPAEK